MRVWKPYVGVILLGGTFLGAILWALSHQGHDPNHGIDTEQARKAAGRVHAPPPAGVMMDRGHGG